MADIIPFSKKQRTKKPANKNGASISAGAVNVGKGNTLCKSGFHKWKMDNTTDFSVKQGKLQTRYRCERCGKIKTEFT